MIKTNMHLHLDI